LTNFGFQPKCRKVSLDKLIITPKGTFEPLCQTCMQRDCGNPIESKPICVFGVTKNWRLYINNNIPMAVVDCEAYIKKEDTDKK
jgi:hypothetical protein